MTIEPTTPAQAPEPDETSIEATGETTGETTGPRRRVGRLIAIVAGVLAILLGAGTWAVVRMLGGGGPLPATVLPADTIAEITVDLDPPAGQKVDALRAVRKFPDLRKELNSDSVDELQRSLIEGILGGDCVADYAKDVEPWIGSRAAIAAVRLGGKLLPEAAIQITDQAKARQGLKKLLACSPDEPMGMAVGEHYAVVSTTDAHAQALLDRATKKPLVDDANYRKWTDAAGGRGVINAYMAPGALATLMDFAGVGDFPGLGDPAVTKSLAKSRPAALAVRVRSDGLELSAVTSGTAESATQPIGPDAARLPGDSAVALGFSVPKLFVSTFTDGFVTGFIEAASPGGMRRFEQLTGLKVRRDVGTLLGHGLVGVIGGQPPADLNSEDMPPDLQVAVVSTGKAADVAAIIQKLTRFFGFTLSDLGVSMVKDSDHVVLGRQQQFNESLLAAGDLGKQEDFRAVVANPDKAGSIFFVHLNDQWRQAIAEAAGPDRSSVEQNLAPFRAFGLSTCSEGKGKSGTSHVQARLLLR